MKLSEHLDKGIWTILDKGLLLLYGFAVILVVANVINVDEWGAFGTFQSVFLILCVLSDSIFLQPMVKFASEHEAEVEEVLAASFNLYTGFLLITGIIIAALSGWLAIVYKSNELAQMFLLMPVLVSLHLFRNVGIRYLQVSYRIKAIFWVDLGLFGSVIVMAVVAGSMGIFKNAYQFMVMNMIGGAISSITALILGWKGFRHMPIFKVPKGEYGRLLEFAKYQAGTSALLTLQQWGDVLIVGLFWTPAEVGIFYAAKTIYRFLDAVREGATLLIVPMSSKLYTAKEHLSLRALVEKLLLLGFGGLIPVSIGLIVLSSPIFHILYKGKYDAASPIFQVMMLSGFTLPLSLIGTNVLIGIGKAKSLFLSTLGATLIFFIMSFALVPFMKSMGAALAVFVSMTALGTFTYFAMRSELEIRATTMISHAKEAKLSLMKRIGRG
jgi:O-antigen/teichoic acid export membrane protein